MSDDVTAGSPATGTTKAETASGGRPDSATGNNEAGSSKSASDEKIEALQKQLNSSFNLIRGLEKTVKDALASGAAKPKNEELDIQAQIEQQRAELRAFKESAIAEKREASIQAAIASHGIDSDNADLLYDHILVRHAKNIVVEGNKVFHRDEVTGDEKPVKDFVAGLLKSQNGDRFKPAPAPGPNSRGLRPSNTTPSERQFFHQLPQAEQDRMMREEPDKARRMVQEDMKSGR